jgi:putative heme-binding domain-containing protein
MAGKIRRGIGEHVDCPGPFLPDKPGGSRSFFGAYSALVVSRLSLFIRFLCMSRPDPLLRSAFALLALAVSPAFAAPEWIWAPGTPNDEPLYFRAAFEVGEVTPDLSLALTCDNKAEVFLNGVPVGKVKEWTDPLKVKVNAFLKPGKNVIAVKAWNEGSAAGLVARLDHGKKDSAVLLETGAKWKMASNLVKGWEQPGFDDATWTFASTVAKLGDAPWGNAFAPGGGGQGGVVLPGDALNVLPGFKAEVVYNVPKATQGSWVSLTLDDKQRFIAGDQEGGIYRITLREGAEPDVQPLPVRSGKAQGLLYVNHALYLVRNGKDGGLFRLRDTNGDDQFDEETLLRPMEGAGEHGPHGIVLGPDGKSLYVVAGNFTKIPDPETSSVPRLWAEDHLITRMPDANGHDPHIMAPAGWVAKTDFDGKSWELVSMGFRNTYDIAFNKDGQLFGYDSDMEWDIGMPWYRPTRVCHVVPGADFGFRNGSGKYPTYYPDSVPPTLNIGPGSPTGVQFGYGVKFPAKYQNALYIMDWTYGTMYAIHLTADGASYRGVKEEFVSGKPLSLTDMVIRPADGAMYFLVGGRGNQSGLYRMTWTGGGDTSPAPVPAQTPELKLRMEIESLLLSPPSPQVVDKVWPYLDHADRFIRFAARSVIEQQPVASWKDKALSESRPWARITGLLALARASKGDQETLLPLLMALGGNQWSSLSEEQQLAVLRTAGVAILRLGPLPERAQAGACAKLDPLFPARSFALNKELCELLVRLGSRQVVPKAIALMGSIASDDQSDLAGKELLSRSEGYAKGVLDAQSSKPNRQQIAYAYALREATTGWSPELYRQYFRWFNTARKFQGGNSLRGFIENMRKNALTHVPAALKGELDSISGELTTTPEPLPQPKGPGKAWTTAELLALTANGLHGRNFENGLTTYKAALCSTCHRFGSEFGGVGPDLSGIGNRYGMADLLDNIMEPSKVISDQYESTLLEKTDGSSIVGRIIKEEGDLISIAENPLNPAQATIVNQSNIKTRAKYPVSAMPPALLYSLNQDEVLDLLAFLMSGGNKDDKAFKN